MATIVIVSIAIGHHLAPRDAEEQTTLAMESAAHHPGLAMRIAALNFEPRKALPVLAPYLIVFMLVTTIYLEWRKRSVKRFSERVRLDMPLDQGRRMF